ncbi:pantoate--beta-alanine ligase [Aldersonia kunmingensis]|uniref:pantoate--beta-alanine ligase n=1 Tax=Aldersonia kunmingensis TaxID=408066 RepID=UPI00082B140F|nr:pantoate--beta-alanine ligase [Aldersonia kunmingensis]
MTSPNLALRGSFTPGELTVHHDPAVVTAVSNALRTVGRKVTFVPTMGALHEGHLKLVRAAKRSNAVVIVSIFVNPLQFGAGEDLDAYPRTLDADVELLRGEGVEIVFAPSAADMYPDGPRTTVHPGPAGAELEGASRPTHFAGMLTVVAKLLMIARAREAYFGEKDYQQLVLVRQMVRDLNIDTKIVGIPTVRESDGLALSSRNRYLDPKQREAALALPSVLVAGVHAGPFGRDAVLEAANEVLSAATGIELDYLELRSPDLGPAPEQGAARLLIAARVGNTRLIDNMPIAIGGNAFNDHPGVNDAATERPLTQADPAAANGR